MKRSADPTHVPRKLGLGGLQNPNLQMLKHARMEPLIETMLADIITFSKLPTTSESVTGPSIEP